MWPRGKITPKFFLTDKAIDALREMNKRHSFLEADGLIQNLELKRI